MIGTPLSATPGAGRGVKAGEDGKIASDWLPSSVALNYPTLSGLTTGAVLRATGATTAAFGALDLANGSAVTGVLPVANGGTGAANASGARTALGAAASGANTDITSLASLSTPLSVAQGGTGAASASAARTSLGAAASGANSDITSLASLSTPLSVAQGGTGAASASAARSSLGAAASGANSDITSLASLSTPLSIAQGGTGAGSAATARTALGAAASGANSDITSIAGLSTPLSIAQGGTGAGSAGAALTALGAAGVAVANTFSLAQTVSINDATNGAVTTALTLTHLTTGTAGNNIGVGVDLRTEDAGNNGVLAGRIQAILSDASNGAHRGALVLSAADSGGAREGIRIGSNGSAVLVGLFGVNPVPRQTGYTTVANLTTRRTFDANATSVDELADALGTLIEDLKALGPLSA